MEKRDLKLFQKFIAVLSAAALMVGMIAMPGAGMVVKAANVFDVCTHHVATNAGVAQVWDEAAGQMGTTGTIPSGSKIGAADGNGATLVGLGALSNETAMDDGKVYTLNTTVNFSISGTTITFTQGSGAAGEADGNNEKADPRHDHNGGNNTANFVWDTAVEASEFADGIMKYHCPDCGYVLYSVPVSAYSIFNAKNTDKIRSAKSGQTITINAGQWVSFHKSVIDEMKKNNSATYTIDYRYNGQAYELTLPAGTDYSKVPEDQFVGFLFLAQQTGVSPTAK